MITLYIDFDGPDHRKHDYEEDPFDDSLHDIESSLIDCIAVVFIDRDLPHRHIQSHIDPDSRQKQEENHKEKTLDTLRTTRIYRVKTENRP